MNFYLEPQDKRKTSFVNLRMEDSLFERIKKRAEQENCSVSGAIRTLITEAL